MTKKDTKANKEEPQANEETPTTAVAKREDGNAYLTLFMEAQEVCINKLQALHDSADDETQVGIQRLMRSAKPVVKGREEMAQNWNIPTVRVVYGTTKDPSKPASAKPGDMYATNGRLLKQPFKFTPLYIYESNRMFQEGSNAPACWSPDAKLGTMFGWCNKCPHQPLGKNPSGEKTDCNNGVCMIVMSEDWKVYRLEFFKTSRKAGASVDRLVQSQDMLWERWFEMSTQQVSSGGYEYYVFKTAPQGEDVPTKQAVASDALYDMIKIERDAFLEKHYEQALANEDSSSASPVDESIDAKAMGIDADDTNPSDLSGGSL
jgi:hypothetical protein